MVVYIAQQSSVEGQPSTIYVVQNEQAQGLAQANHGAYGSQTPNATPPGRGSSKKGDQEETNPIRIMYDSVMLGNFVKWLSGILVMGLAAGILSKNPEHMLLVASAYNVACGAIHIFQIGPWVTPKMTGPRSPRPASWHFALLATSSVMWIVAFSLMFLVLSDDQKYAILGRRSWGKLIGTTSMAAIEGLRNITIAAGCFGVSAFLGCIFQWYYMIRVSTVEWNDWVLKEAWEKASSV